MLCREKRVLNKALFFVIYICMTPFLKSKVIELNRLIKLLSERQREIRREIQKSDDHEYKNYIAAESDHNKCILRIMNWVRMVLRGTSIEKRIKRDPDYLRWMNHTRSIEIRDAFAEIMGLDIERYKHQGWSGCWYYNFGGQSSIYQTICNHLFPETAGGIFGLQLDDAVETDIWRATLRELPKKELQKLKELKGY